MKILSWNCNMSFRKKSAILNEFCPDVAIIQECESKEFLSLKKVNIQFDEYIWIGKNINKGLGVMAFNGFHIEILEHNEEFEFILPIRIYKDQIEIFLLAVWTQLINKNIYKSYVVQATRAFNYYKGLLLKENVLIIGDFNSNAIWDNGARKEYNHSQMVKILKQNNIVSAYHTRHREEHGKEKTPTFYLSKNKDKSFHIDYFFIKESLLNKVEDFLIGDYEKYISQSDHMPLFITIETSSTLTIGVNT